MDSMVEFKSNLFIPFLPEESQVNPHVYGAELSYWLSQKLVKKNIITSYPNNEDWGWFIEYFVDDYEYMLCCSNFNENGTEWRCFLKPQSTNFFGTKKAPLEKAHPLLLALKEILNEETGITDVKWTT